MEQVSPLPPQSMRRDPRQYIKLIVYVLLLVNFGNYIAEDMMIASHTVGEGATFLAWTAAFTTSIDLVAWFVLLFLFELETYLLSDEAFTKARTRLIHGVRLVCYLFLAHGIFSYGNTVLELRDVEQVAGVDNLCHWADSDVSWGKNIYYEELDQNNCQTLSQESEFYLIERGTVVTDGSGFELERQLTFIDLAEASTWLLILLFIELGVRLQDRGVAGGPLLRTVLGIKFFFYTMLWGAAAFWLYHGHYLYAWDEALWIFGFVAIEMNMSDWRKEIRAEEADLASACPGKP